VGRRGSREDKNDQTVLDRDAVGRRFRRSMKPTVIQAGDPASFSIKLLFNPDPDKGLAATSDESASWGGFQLWVQGKNLCQYQCRQEVFHEPHWYLLPILEWLVDQWGPILHEERFPLPTRHLGARNSYLDAVIPSLTLFDDDTEHKQQLWESWWNRHALRSHRDGGLLPDVFIRRWRNTIEFSWGNSDLPGAPEDFYFLCPQSVARLSVDRVSTALFEAADHAADYLLSANNSSQRFQQLKNACSKIPKTPTNNWDAWLTHTGSTLEHSKEAILEAEASIKQCPRQIVEAIFSSKSNGLAVTEESHAALMFGTVSPDISRSDVHKIVNLMVKALSVNGEAPEMQSHIPLKPLSTTSRPYTQGYELALDFMDSVSVPELEGSTDVGRLVKDLNIQMSEIEIDDKTIRGLSMAGPKQWPTILINRASEWNMNTWGQRFSAAHELCHVLYDRAPGERFAIASGPWAPRDIEQRANAFAAMLIMPIQKVNEAVRQLAVPLASSDAIFTIARTLKTSPVATLEHLYNLHKLDDFDRDKIRSELVVKAHRS
jgi:Zn-dependent peptidase ImmA (M78 family)